MSELSELPPFFFAAAGGVDARGVDAAVSENVRKPHNVLEPRVVRPGEQVAQVVGVLGDCRGAIFPLGEGIGKAPRFGVGDNEHDTFSFSVKWVNKNYIMLILCGLYALIIGCSPCQHPS